MSIEAKRRIDQVGTALKDRVIDPIADQLSISVRRIVTNPSRVGLATFLAGAGILSPADPINIGQAAIQEALNSLKGRPDKTAQAGPFSTINSRLIRVDAAGNYRVLLPEAFSDYKPSGASVSPNGTPTPELTRTPLPEGAYYAPWPTEIANAMTRLVLPENVRLVRSATYPPGQPGCIRACYLQTKEVWFLESTSDPDPAPELLALVYELGHGHQQARREMGGKAKWEETTEYQAFLVTRDRVNAILRARGDSEWTQDPYHLFTNIWAGYFVGDPNFQNAPPNWNHWVPNPYSDHLIDWKNYMDTWARR